MADKTIEGFLGDQIAALEKRVDALERANVALTGLVQAPALPPQAASATLQPYSPKGPTAKYEVLSPIFHAGKRWRVGDTVDMTEDEAAPVLALNAVTLVVDKPAPAKAPKK